MQLTPQLPDVDKKTSEEARENLEKGTVDLALLPITLVYSLIPSLQQLIPLASSWQSQSKQGVKLDDALRENLRNAKKYVRDIVALIDRGLTLGQGDEQLNVLLHVIANDLKSRIILIYSGAELMIDEHPDSLSQVEIEQLLSFMIKGLHRTLLYVDKIVNLGPNVTMETLHPWRS